MKKKVIVLAVLLAGLFAWLPITQQSALAAEKTAQMTIPGCST